MRPMVVMLRYFWMRSIMAWLEAFLITVVLPA
jgi:hypothetical protein